MFIAIHLLNRTIQSQSGCVDLIALHIIFSFAQAFYMDWSENLLDDDVDQLYNNKR